MSFFKKLFRNKTIAREQLARYVAMEYPTHDREAEFNRLAREAGL